MKLQGMMLYVVLPLTSIATMAAAGPEEEAAAAAAAEKMQTEAGQADSNAMVCKKFPPPTGTRLGARQICKTNAEWRMLERAQQNDIAKLQSMRSRDAPGRGFSGESGN